MAPAAGAPGEFLVSLCASPRYARQPRCRCRWRPALTECGPPYRGHVPGLCGEPGCLGGLHPVRIGRIHLPRSGLDRSRGTCPLASIRPGRSGPGGGYRPGRIGLPDRGPSRDGPGAARPPPGIWLAFAALGIGGAGVLFGASTVPMGSPRLRPYNQSLHPRALVTTLVALLAVAAFLPSWDRYEVVNSAGQTLTVTLGNAFAQPAGIMAGELVAAFAIGVIAILGAFWAPPSVGAWMTGGALVALTAQLISAAVQVNQPLSVTIAGQRATVSLTGYWAIDVGAAVALAALATWAGLAARSIPGQLGSRRLAPGQSTAGSPLEQRPPAEHWPGLS